LPVEIIDNATIEAELTEVEVVLHAVAEDQDTGDGVNDG
jgi:hypothetical protein